MPTSAEVPGRLPIGVDGHIVERLFRRVQILPEGCWVTKGPYAKVSFGSRGNVTLVMFYRLFYEWFVGPIPEGYEVDHLCRNPCCVRPEHLEAVPPKTNKLRSFSPWANNARKTHCIRGHEFSPENTRVEAGRRVCRTCNIAWKRAFRAARKAL